MLRTRIYWIFPVLAALSAAGCQQHVPAPLFQLRSPAETGIDFVNNVQDRDSMNIIQYLYYYNGGGVAVGDINNDGLPDIYFSSNLESNRLYLNKGNFQFEDITESAGVGGTGDWTAGVSMVDINNDGRLDIYVCQVSDYKGFEGKNQLFINNGNLQFTEQAAEYGLDPTGLSTQAAFLDYDLDGDLDLYLLRHSVHSTATYRDTSLTRKRDDRSGDRLYRNDLSEGTAPFFTEVTQDAGIYDGIAGYGLGIAVGDVDRNGCPDIYVSNDFHENDFLYLNNCDGTFSERSTQAIGHTSNFSMGNDLADFNNDGWLDIVTLDMKPDDEVIFKNAHGIDPYDIYRFKRSFGYHHQYPRNMLQLNRRALKEGEVRFSEIGQLAGIAATDWSWSALLADFDNDGWKDLHISNGIVRRPNDLDYLKYIANRQIQEEASDLELAAQMPDGKCSNYLFANRGDWTFEDQTLAWGLQRPSLSNGGAYADLDNDGDLDLVVNNINEPAFIYENKTDSRSGGNYLSIRLKGPEKNPLGVGAKVSLFAGGNTQYQELYPVRGWQSSVDYRLFFGLGPATIVDSILVEWPNGKQEQLRAVEGNQTLVLDYAAAEPAEPSANAAYTAKLFEDISSEVNLPYRHRENRFFDNNREPLIPYLLSTQGPALAVGDVNRDGLDDLFVGGATQQSGLLFLQDATGAFIKRSQNTFVADSLSEDVDAVFFDADNDGDLDLYVGSAGNQYYQEHETLRDRLYFNNGEGGFSRREDALPLIADQTSCVVPADFDRDGDIDLFIGSRSTPVSYGIGPDSYLLENDGKGNFVDSSERMPGLINLGMVTDAAWTDLDKDGDLDLVVVGEWMPLTIFLQDKGRFSKKEIPNSSGWWKTIETADFDRDGDEDWILGNFGVNSNLQPSEKEPLRLYIKDFDGNLSRDPVISYYRQQREYPYANLDELSNQLIFLKKRFNEYHRFAQSTIREVFTDAELDRALRLEVHHFHSVLVRNDGRGRFVLEQLPPAAQMAPVQSIEVNDFDGDGFLDVLLGGNFYDAQPSIGRLDASYGTFLKGRGDGTFRTVENDECGLLIEGQVRHLKGIEIAGRPAMVIARNDEPLQFLRIAGQGKIIK